MRRPSLPRIFRFALLSTFIVCSYVVAAASSVASDAAIVGTPAGRAPRDAAVPVVTDVDGAPLTPAGCNGSLLVLTPGTPAPSISSDNTPFQRGVYVTAIKDFTVCSLGCKIQVTGQSHTLFAYIYAANGTTRGSLVASGSVAMSETGNVMHLVTMNYTLEACHDYELAFSIPVGDLWEWWDDGGGASPFDAGVIRVRDAAIDGDPINAALMHIEVVGNSAPASATLSDFGGPGAAPTSKLNDFEERGVYVHMLSTAQLCSFGFEANLVAGQTLTARVYAATGTTRGSQLASGTYTVPASGLQWHDVPVNCQLVEGHDYDIAITFGDSNSWPWWNETVITEPYSINAFQVVTSELAGAGANTVLPHYRARWEDKTGGTAFDLAKLGAPNPPPLSSSSSFEEYGAFVTLLAKEEVYGIGWKADVPAGQPITATIYEAVGNVRGFPISTATITSGASGMRWHDVPLVAELQSGTDYDIAIAYELVNEVRYWGDVMGVPYTSYGVIQVRNGESVGNAASTVLIDMRIHMCNGTLTAVTDRPARTPMFIAAPAPNPVSNVSRLDFSLDDAGPVSIRVYDVAGRLVNTVLNSSRPPGWSHTELTATSLPSGVYFLKMETPAGSLTRKFVVAH